MNKYEEIILHEIRENQPINVKGLRRIICDNPKYPNRMGTPTLEKYIRRLHEDGYTNLREVKNQKFYSVISNSGFKYDDFIKKIDSSYNKLEKNIKNVLKHIQNDTYDKKIHVYLNAISLLLGFQNLFQISNILSQNRISSNSYETIVSKFKKLLINVIDQVEPDTESIIIRNIEKKIQEFGANIDKYKESYS